MFESLAYDVIIIGGGVAGSAAAILLARAGKNVLLLEKEAQAHHKVCGEFLSFEAEHYLKDLDFDLVSMGAESINKIRLICGRKSVTSSLPFSASSLSRFVLDEALLNKAISINVKVMRGITVKELEHQSTGWCVETSHGKFNADTVFLATGKHDLRGWNRSRKKKNDLIGFKMHYELQEDKRVALSNHVEFVLFSGGYAGLEPIENNKTNLCLVVKKSKYVSAGKEWAKFLDSIFYETPYLLNQLTKAKACWEKPLAAYGIPYGFIYHDIANDAPSLYRIGDQMAVIPSFSGEGMAIALHTANKAVSSYLESNAVIYHRKMRKELFPQIKRASLMSKILFSRLGRYSLLATCSFAPKSIRILASTTRISRELAQTNR